MRTGKESVMTGHEDTVFYDAVYPHFKSICALRRPSNDEREVVDYIKNHARKHNLPCDSDIHGNVAIYRSASAGLEHRDPLLFQGHLDMVCVPDQNIFPINPIISDGWVHTGESSTLGADNGIAVAIMLELSTMPLKKNPPMEFLFTVAEEVGLVGATSLEVDTFNLHAPRLINIDSEDIKYITVGCSGAKNLDITLRVAREPCSAKHAFRINIHGPGGHSGLVIHENIPNTLKIGAELLKNLNDNFKLQTADFTGGLARNAIPADAQIIVCSDILDKNDIQAIADNSIQSHKDVQPFSISIETSSVPETAFTRTSQDDIIDLVLTMPHGVIKMNTETGGVLSSINLGVIESHDTAVKIITSARSCEEKEIDEIFESIEQWTMKYSHIQLDKDDGYPGWRPDLDSKSAVLNLSTSTYMPVWNAAS